MRVTLRSGERITLENPTMRNDSIFSSGVVGVASEDIGLVEVRRLSILRSIGLGSLTLGVAFLAGAAIVALLECPRGC